VNGTKRARSNEFIRPARLNQHTRLAAYWIVSTLARDSGNIKQPMLSLEYGVKYD